MRAIGIVAEFNPFHLGHQRLIDYARESLQADVIVVAMSGDLVQRGEIAFADLKTRTEWALDAGVDLVIGQPVWGSLQAADRFASAGIHSLSMASCQAFLCGSEWGSADQLLQASQLVKAADPLKLKQALRSKGQGEVGYAERLQSFWSGTCVERFMQQPNSQLALSYALANADLDQAMTPYLYKRATAHDQKELDKNCEQVSGSILRQIFREENVEVKLKNFPIFDWIPQKELKSLIKFGKIEPYDFWPLLQHILLTSSMKQIESIYGVDEGIGPRLVTAAKEAVSYEDWLRLSHHRRITYARLRRLAMCLVFQLTREDMAMDQRFSSQARRILGASEKGRNWLKGIASGKLLASYKLYDQLNPIDRKVEIVLENWYHPYGVWQRMKKPVIR
ncbi:hypothetical protein D3H64_06835 [Atopobacter sp. AH10]|uniref:nucleotidyltransferase family protein n=1 Tax=Atopobacter sp. AH10 TaxID=2315861 RepID=UPI000EF24E7D|nr:nucleotidyltransferase family protein [Atopobacter sp. AH10]RLK62930.1 hypothetical protein D3H64_06835 [Atopobacter sp. AH10]